MGNFDVRNYSCWSAIKIRHPFANTEKKGSHWHHDALLEVSVVGLWNASNIQHPIKGVLRGGVCRYDFKKVCVEKARRRHGQCQGVSLWVLRLSIIQRKKKENQKAKR